METTEALKREEFLERMNNFPLHFAREKMFAEAYRGQHAFKECMARYPDDFKELVEELQELMSTPLGNRPQAQYHYKLYRAYRMMRPFAQSDDELFS